MFGASTAMGQNQNTQQGSLFGQSANQQAPLLAQSQQGQQMPALSQSQAQLSASFWQPGRDSPYQKPITEQMQSVTDKWDPSKPTCVFKHHFYNKVDQAHIPYYKPQPFEDTREWEEALQNKPASGFMPVLCLGSEGVSDRLKTQARAISEFNTRLHQVNGSLDAILQRHELDTDPRALTAKRRQTTLNERCLALAGKIQVLRNRGFALSGDEDDLKGRLQKLERDVQDPAVGAREEELWSRLIVLRQYADQLNKEMDKPSGKEENGLDEETETKAKRVLEDYERQIQHLKKEIETMAKDFIDWEKITTSGSRGR